VACGRLDCFWEFHLHAWDVAAGKLLVQEAGGRVTDTKGDAHHLDSASVLATNQVLHVQMLAAFQEIVAEKYRTELPPLRPPASD